MALAVARHAGAEPPHVAAGRLRAVVDRVLPLSRVQEAHRLLEERGVFGKVILTP